MKRFLPLIGLMTSLSFAHAQSFIATLDAAQDGGGARMGSGIVNLTLTGTTLTLSGSFSGLSANATAAHIHGPAAPLPGSAGVIYGLGTTVIPLGATSGTIGGSVNLVPLGVGGSYTVAQQTADLNNGLWYVNIHDSTFGGGEIRGQILPVPEPSTLALAALGLSGLVFWRARRRSV